MNQQTGDFEAALLDAREATNLALFETNGLADLLISQVDTRAALEQNQQALLERTSELREQTLIDDLSQVGNRRSYEAYIESLRDGAARDVSVVLFDIDCFKDINDQRGHTFGDQVIARVGALTSEVTAGMGRVFRYGGDEFVVVVDGSPDQAAQLAEQIRSAFIDEQWGESALPITITCSVGVWSGTSCEVAHGLGKADQQMYEAKNAGRNIVRPVRAVS